MTNRTFLLQLSWPFLVGDLATLFWQTSQVDLWWHDQVYHPSNERPGRTPQFSFQDWPPLQVRHLRQIFVTFVNWGMCEKWEGGHSWKCWASGQFQELQRPRKIADQSFFKPGWFILKRNIHQTLEWRCNSQCKVWFMMVPEAKKFLNQGNLPPELHHHQHLLLEHLPRQVPSSFPFHIHNFQWRRYNYTGSRANQ